MVLNPLKDVQWWYWSEIDHMGKMTGENGLVFIFSWNQDGTRDCNYSIREVSFPNVSYLIKDIPNPNPAMKFEFARRKTVLQLAHHHNSHHFESTAGFEMLLPCLKKEGVEEGRKLSGWGLGWAQKYYQEFPGYLVVKRSKSWSFFRATQKNSFLLHC